MAEKTTNLKKYTAVAGAVIASSSVNSQIVYTDITDVTIDKNATPYQLDFNGDLTADLVLQVGAVNSTATATTMGITFTYTLDASYAAVGVNAGGGVLGVNSTTSSGGTSFNVSALNNGDAIGAAGVFGGTGSSGALLAAEGLFNVPAFSFTQPIAVGNFLGVTDKYLGAKFTAGANTHYGWVRLSCTDGVSNLLALTIKDYAFNSTADGGINAGQQVAGLEGVAVDNKVSIKTQLDEALINVTPDLVGGELVIINMAGQEVKSQVIGDVNAKITYEGLETGIYTLVARFEAGSVTKKIYVR
ncbi:MAG: T9SS type A sorting domain-containing protein [Flavobacteriia bacterium]|jgi:hypothetical protein